MATTFFEQEFYGNSLQTWLFALAIAAVTFSVLQTVRLLGTTRLKQWAEQTTTWIDDLVVEVFEATSPVTIAVFSLDLGARGLTLPQTAESFVAGTAIVALCLQGGIWGNRLVSAWLSRYRLTPQGSEQATALGALSFVARVLLWALVLLLSLDNLGFDITTLVASLGIGGIALGLAVQNILGDLFASLSIVFDKPFRVGDFITLDAYMGKVEHVGLKTTRVRSLSGEQIVFANSDLIKSRLRNFANLEERRVAFTLNVTYRATHDQLARIPRLIQEIIEAQAPVRFDRAHFQSFGTSALIFEIVYFVLDPDYNLYMDIQQGINLRIVKGFEAEGISFAYPTPSLPAEQPPTPIELSQSNGKDGLSRPRTLPDRG